MELGRGDHPLRSTLEADLSRRRLLGLGLGGVLGLSGVLQAMDVLRDESWLPDLPGGLDQSVRDTIAAYADTIVPGPAGGADPQPGAVEAGVVDELYDPFYGVSGSFPALHTDIQVATPRVLGRFAGFDLDLPYDDRERVMLDRIERFPAEGTNPLALLYQGVGILVHFVYYGVAASKAGPRVIGFPPSSDGYPDHSYQVRFRGMTPDGNPH